MSAADVLMPLVGTAAFFYLLLEWLGEKHSEALSRRHESGCEARKKLSNTSDKGKRR